MPRRQGIALALFALLALVLALGLRDVDFIQFDDQLYITDNDWVLTGLSQHNFVQAWRLDHPNTYWHPLTWLSLQLSASLHGPWAPGFVLLNGLLHLASAVVVFVLLAIGSGRYWASALVAFLFFVHPFQIESVAWTVERKTVLSGALMLLSLLLYGTYARGSRRRHYLLSLTLFALALLAKPTVATLAAALLVIDYWPLRRWPTLRISPRSWLALRPLLLEKIPYFTLAALGVGLAWMSTQSMASQVSLHKASLLFRLADAARVFALYPWDVLTLSPLLVYIRPTGFFSLWMAVPVTLLLLALTTLFYRLRQRAPFLLVGWLWYGVFLLPVSGIVRNGLWPDRANRFLYLPLLGLLVAAIFGADALLACRPRLRRLAPVVAMGAVLTCTWISYSYARVWRTPYLFWRHALTICPDDSFASRMLGIVNNNDGNSEQAELWLRKALALSWPLSNLEEESLGRFLVNHGRLSEGLEHMDRSLVTNPLKADLWRASAKVSARLARPRDQIRRLNRALACKRGLPQREREAVRAQVAALLAAKVPELSRLKAALAARPQDLQLRARLAFLQQELGLFEQALPQFEAMARTAPDRWQAHFNLGNLLYLMGRDKEAIAALERAVAAGSDYAEVFNKLGLAYRRLDQYPEAEAALRKAIAVPSHDGKAALNLVLVLYLQGRLDEAKALLLQVQHRYPSLEAEIEMRQRALQ